MITNQQHEYIQEFFENQRNFIKTVVPNLTITLGEAYEACFKYDKELKELLKIIQNILKREFENGNLYGHIKFLDIKPFLDKEIEQKWEKVDSYHLDISNIYEKF